MDIDEFNFVLDHMERASSVWTRVKGQLQLRLEQHRRKNDNKMAPEETAYLRGQIACLKSILDFGADPPPPIVDGDLVTDTLRRRARQ